MKRRHCLATLASFGLTPFGIARAQSAPGSYPTQVVKLVAPYPPGGTVDILARALAQQLGKELGQPVIVENRGGAGGTVGAQIAAQAAKPKRGISTPNYFAPWASRAYRDRRLNPARRYFLAIGSTPAKARLY